MSGIGGIGDLGNVDLSAWIGLNGIGSVTNSAAVSAPMAGSVESVGLNSSLQFLVQALQQFSLAEILLALLLTSNTRRCDRRCEDSAASGLAAFALASTVTQLIALKGDPSSRLFVPAVAGSSAPMVNVAG